MPSSSPVAAPPVESPRDPLVLVSDTTTEAERLIASLRARGFKVRDVPLMLMAGRVETQHPNLVVCDGSATKIIDALDRMHGGEWGKGIEVLLLGGDPSALKDKLSSIGIEVKNRLFPRPIDVYSILQSVEELIGSPPNHPAMPGLSLAELPRLPPISLRDSASPRAPTPAPHRRSSGPAPSIRLPSGAIFSQGETVIPGRTGPSRPPPEEPVPLQQAPQFPVTHVSKELEYLLENAEHKLGPVSHSLQPTSQPAEHMSPEAELDAILPPDVLAALDEPLEVDDVEELSNAGTHAGDKSRFRSNVPPSSPMFERDTGTGKSRPGGTFAAVGTSMAPVAPGTLSGTTPVPASRGSFVPVSARMSPPTVSGESSGAPDSLPPPTVFQPPQRRGFIIDDDTDAPVFSSKPSLRPKTEAEAAADAASPLPIPDDVNEQNSTAPPVANHTHDSPRDSLEPKEPTRPPNNRMSRPRTLAPRLTAPSPVRERPPDNKPQPAALAADVVIPSSLGKGDVVRALAELIRGRFSGAYAVEDEQGVRRVVLRDGDFVMVASGIEGESLVAFLIQRGNLSPDAARLERKLPQFGRHAGAALIAHGHLRQDELWPVLRAHAEWLLGKTLSVEQGSGDVETELPPRLQSEPAVFGGATGAEVLIETLRRVLSPEFAMQLLGGQRGRLAFGPSRTLLNECALSNQELQIIDQSAGKTISHVLKEAGAPDFANALHALVALRVLTVLAPSAKDAEIEPAVVPRDAFDDSAVRQKIALRRALVDEGDYFAFLGVEREATGYEIRHAYLDLRHEFEPSTILTAATAELRDDVDLIIEVLDEAYEIMRDNSRRERYRRALAADPH